MIIKDVKSFVRILKIRKWVAFTERSLEDPTYSNKAKRFCPACGGVSNIVDHPYYCSCEPPTY